MDNLEEIYKKNVKYVYMYLLSLTHNKEISEDITHETFYKHLKIFQSFEENVKYKYGYAKLPRIYGYSTSKRKKLTRFLLMRFMRYQAKIMKIIFYHMKAVKNYIRLCKIWMN